MRMRHEYLATRPVDLYAMHLFELVASLGGFTRAAEAAGLSQSAVTRQIQNMEEKLGVPLLERTTRKVALTDAGRLLLSEARKFNGALEDSLRRFREEHVDGAKSVRVGFSRSIGLASLPGILAPFHRHSPEVRLQVSHEGSDGLMAALLDHRLDIAVLPSPKRLNPALEVRHRYTDEFELIIGAQQDIPAGEAPWPPARMRPLAEQQQWVLLDMKSNTGRNLAAWLHKQRWNVHPAMELDNFEIIIHLVAMGFGASLVPRRALAAYPRKKALQRVPLKQRFEREIVILTRRSRVLPRQVRDLIDRVLFS
jgi:DNA-binding transcriptional LysR family regulator